MCLTILRRYIHQRVNNISLQDSLAIIKKFPKTFWKIFRKLRNSRLQVPEKKSYNEKFWKIQRKAHAVSVLKLLTLSWLKSLLYRNESIDLLCIRHERVKKETLEFLFFFFGNFPGRFFTEHSEKKSFWKLLKSKIEIIKLPVKRFFKKRLGYLFTRAITNYCCLCWMHFHWGKISQEFAKLRLTKTQSSKVWLSKKAIVNVFWDKTSKMLEIW